MEPLLYLLVGLLVLGAFYRKWASEEDQATAVFYAVMPGILIVLAWPIVAVVWLGVKAAENPDIALPLVFMGVLLIAVWGGASSEAADAVLRYLAEVATVVSQAIGGAINGLGNFLGQPTFLGLALWLVLLGAIPVLLLGSLLVILTGIILVKGVGGLAVVLREVAKRATFVNVTTVLLGFLITALFLARALGLVK